MQRLLTLFGKPKVPNFLTIEIDKALSLKEIAATLVGIHDTLRYMVGYPKLPRHSARVCFALTLGYKAHLPPLDV